MNKEIPSDLFKRVSFGEEKLRLYENMKKYGGSFVRALGECIVRADKGNLYKLCLAFPEYIEVYLSDKWK